ncbi:GFA family protein [Type-D symbiont of Plautia stali]|uniref:GFA family protein n=1 Tax=Type-D symbiont of Plautia stali TaxID=1560356 RepID=UPI003F6F8448
MVVSGSCLCDEVAFKLYVRPLKYYRSHWPLCRKQYGTGYNIPTIMHSRDLEWAHDTENVINCSGGRNTDMTFS